LKAQILESKNEADKAKFWKQLFPKMKLQVISQSIPIIQSLINSYLSDLMPDLIVELQVDPSSHKKIDVIINSNGRKRIFEGYNVGCQHQMALSSFMALNRLASLRSGKSVNFLLLDEKFASLDNESRDDVFNLLRHNYKDRKLFAISHLEGIESEFNEVVDVKFLNGVSSL
jgi:DNA repair exonuclease SbcCD ATPase subunit